MQRKIYLTVIFLFIGSLFIKAQLQVNKTALQKTAAAHALVESDNYNKALRLAKQKGWTLSYKTKNGGLVSLVRTNSLGKPMYLSTHNNIIAAATTGASKLWPGGSSGLSLNGSTIAKGKLAMWDGGAALSTHVELIGRIKIGDTAVTPIDHTTHVAGTLIASGVNPVAKGMAFGVPQLTVYDYNNDASEMSAAAPNLLLSNHSYGYLCGWYNDGTNWYWEGDITISKTKDYGFGYYDQSAQMFDSISYNAPNYLICMSAGNSRNENGPDIGGSYKYYDSSGNLKTAIRTAASDIDSNNSYGTIAYTQNAKNILTIGAVSGIPLGYNNSSDVVMSDFSSWGPTDDGRIKPDVVADGVNVTSCVSTSNTAYATYSGTSMASPNATGSLYLLQEYYYKLHSFFMRSATLKGLAIHAADEAGLYEGPDYQYGWGLLDVAKAANVITSSYNHQTDTIIESSLNNGAIYTFNVIASGKGPLTATIAWIDPPITPIPDNTVAVLNNTTPRLVNDLDMRITQGSNTYMPWVLDPSNPSNAATRGDNKLDNVEKIQIDSAVAGKTYTIKITHKGTLQRASQAFSLIISGIGGNSYCTSASTNTSGTRIDSVAFAGITNKNAAGNHNYSDFTNLVANVQPGQTLPIAVKVNSSDGSSATRKLKVYIDYNNNGSFYDAGELAVSNSDNSINGTGGIFTGNINVPASVIVGYTSIMRIIVKDSSVVADSISPCGTYAGGETQDYRIQFNQPSNDVSVAAIVAPVAGACANNSQFLVVALRNNGTVAQSNIPVSATVSNGSTIVASFNIIYPGTIAAGGIENYVFQQPFTSVTGATYTITATANLSTDQNPANNTQTTNVTIAGTATAPMGTAEICSSTAYLNVTDSSSLSNYFWYQTSSSATPLAAGTSVTTSTIPSNKTYYLQSGNNISAGPLNKTVYGTGGYNAFNANYISYTSAVPLTLNVAKLYIGNPGSIIFTVADISNITSTGYNYLALASNTIDVYNTTPTATAPSSSGAANPDVAADSGAYYYLNLPLPSGSHYIIVQCTNNSTIYRNNPVATNPYPVGVPNAFTITGNSATSTTNANLYQQYYYFFYDMKLSTSDCMSAMTPIVATTASTPTISTSGKNLLSSITNAKSYQWYLDGATMNNAIADTVYPYKQGSYTVSVTDSVGCSLTSAAYNFTVTAVNNVNNNDIGLKVSPNPSSGNFNVNFTLPSASNVDIELIGSTGQIYLTKHYSALTGTFSETFNSGNVATGTYILKVQAGNNTYWTKVLIVR